MVMMMMMMMMKAQSYSITAVAARGIQKARRLDQLRETSIRQRPLSCMFAHQRFVRVTVRAHIFQRRLSTKHGLAGFSASGVIANIVLFLWQPLYADISRLRTAECYSELFAALLWPSRIWNLEMQFVFKALRNVAENRRALPTGSDRSIPGIIPADSHMRSCEP